MGQLGWCEGMLTERAWWQRTSKAMRRREGRKNVAGTMLDSVCHPGGQASWEEVMAGTQGITVLDSKLIFFSIKLSYCILFGGGPGKETVWAP